MESYIVGTVGQLQFDVLEYRLKSEYNTDIVMNMQPYEVARWLRFKDNRPVTPESLRGADRGMFVYDIKERPVLLVNNEWALVGFRIIINLEMFPVPPEKQDAKEDIRK